MTSGTKARRKMGTRSPQDRELHLTERDIALLNAIVDYGGCLTTVQLALLFWPPSLVKKLQWWQIGPETAEELVAQYPARHLNERVELAKWLLKIQQHDPALWVSLNPFLKNIAEVGPKMWLLRAIETDLTLPDAFLARPKLASQWVSRACTSRLRFLLDSGYLEPEEQRTRLSEGRSPLLWFLSKQGRDFVSQVRKVSAKELDWRRAGSFSAFFLHHRIAINDFRIAVSLAAARLGFEVRAWQDDHLLRKINSQPSEKVTLTSPKDPQEPEGEGMAKKVAVVPDGYFWLWTGDKNFHNFLEIDLRNVTGQYSDPGRKDWAQKIRAYSAYYTSGRYQQRYPEAGSSMRVLTVTTSQARLATLKEVTERVVGQRNESGLNRYWFTTFDQISPTSTDFFSESVVTGKIWQIAGREEWCALVW